MIILKRLGLGLLLCSSLILSACHTPNIEDNPSEKAKAMFAAKKYLKAFYQGDFEKTMDLSVAPFWADGDLLGTRPILERALKGQLNRYKIKPKKNHVKNIGFFTMNQIELSLPHVYHRLRKTGFTPPNMFAIALNIELRDQTWILFVQKQADGMWKVIGLDD